ncbi:nickel-dependent hydrogenase large subunit [Phaeobacter gallaeciensis]|uniref:nickel-dependent hydrogenase large subunit n=1 Tax=Phaeobacter gallaeciensis TaxID=60890 RepID=UPI00237F8A42|nr:nickel-dependent hydrogenase large subunit [Phaeobacter gallaeciensis]MDE4100008.1 nickel-dependent hydrogenase large subunit [Phaeobacter gallaeciensis]MDE4108800.1 nickel-dependent hydrogenase large subunit [Phaeobacter gallaeciensis]MDE4113246.1 nickel-dependent hydrogenase large subunit [Phaeobacter gallaeciensis]MDE4117687.1 nickel-dependent hydrogenase large subunit [Phaeobacter gallaeciensis]MDE4122190.1 nickel-dependent hydrogenase large subunit [Phaeobacter gallaeciensis]
MTERSLLVGPFNRVEGDLEIRLDVKNGKVAQAFANSPMFRGFEMMMIGKAPMDALTITPRICGICSISQSAASSMALGALAGRQPAPQGALAAAILHGVENICDHLTHFNLFFCADFARMAYEPRTWHARAVSRFTAMDGSAVRSCVAARAQVLHIVGLLGGKWPHTLAIQPGGVTHAPTARDRIRMQSTLAAFRRYLENVLFGAPVEAFARLESAAAVTGWDRGDAGLFMEIAADLDLAGLGPGPGRYLSFGAYPLAEGRALAPGVWEDGTLRPVDSAQIREDISHSWMLGETAHPAQGNTDPDEDMTEPGYSWCKAPRLDGRTVETGALARQVVDGHPAALDLVRDGSNIRARVAGRLLEIARTQLLLEDWVAALRPEERFMEDISLPADGSGEGLVEAARGALGHWITIRDGKVSNYQIVAPTTWNFSPRDANGTPGPVEAALEGAPVGADEDTPLSVQHIVRSFDPCMVCTVH